MNNQNTFLEDERLSFKAKGLMGYLLSLPSDYKIIQSDIVKSSKDGKDSVRAGINELIKLGYLFRNSERNEDGNFTGYKYTMNETTQSFKNRGVEHGKQ